MTYGEMISAGEGWMCNGVGRVAESGFRNADWASCLFHFASRDELQVMWIFEEDEGHSVVSTYRRLN
jgi:hypothetical protein